MPEAAQAQPQATVLIVDDNADARRLLTLLLAPEGYRLLTAADGREALELAESTPDLSLIILDVMMPGMDGLEVCREFRARQRDHYVPVILATALADDEHLAAGLAAGADDYLVKPLGFTEVLARVRTALRLKRALDGLIEARQLAAIGAMQVTLAHEINNPLAIAQGNLELLLRDAAGDASARGHIKSALAACERIGELVQRLVELKKVTTTPYLGAVRMLDLAAPARGCGGSGQ